MKDKIIVFFQKNRQFIPIMATALLAVIAYAVGASLYPGMRTPQVFLNIFRNNSYVLVSAVGMTLVILTGGIDLSVSGMVALTSVATAALLRDGMNAWLVILLMLLMGMTLGAIMGSFIAFLKAQPWIATLAGMWFTRGLCFFISDDAISIKNRTFDLLARTRFLVPGLAEFSTSQGKAAPYITISVIVSLVVLLVGMYISKYTRFGRAVYAIGGNEGRNEQSARLMGLPVNATKVLVYTINGFCSALAGILFSLFVTSGHGLYAAGLEMDVIASVVMGGTMLTGGVGYVFGAFFGVFILGLTQTLIQFNGTLSSWWTKIVIGMLTLMFIGVQSLINSPMKSRKKDSELTPEVLKKVKRKRALTLAGTIVVAVMLVLLIIFAPMIKAQQVAVSDAAEAARCTWLPYRQDKAAELLSSGAIIVYERNGGSLCIDELYAFYPDGRITGDNGAEVIEKNITIEELDLLRAGIVDNGWFTSELYDTWHTPCNQCYGYYLSVVNEDGVKTVKGVDGGTDAPSSYWQIISLVKGIIPKFSVGE